MDFRLLGSLEASERGRPVPLGGPRQRAVLAHLLVRANAVVSGDRLIDEVWGDDPPQTARSTLQAYISRLRGVLSDGTRIEGRPPGYVLRVDPKCIDAVRFEALVREGRELLSEDPEASLQRLEQALRLWRGTPLADLADELSVRAERARLEELRLSAVEDRIVANVALGREGDLLAELESLVEEQPLRERLWEHLMLALYRSGRQADALAAYQRARRLLADELGLDPSPQLRELQGRILRQDPSLEPEAARLRGYRLLEQIGAGSHGVVHRALQPHVGREVAVKVINPKLANDLRFVRRFAAEAQIVARLEHPRIVPLYDHWRDLGGAYLVMRLLRGGSLEQRLEEGPLEPEQAIALVGQVAAGLAAAHRQGIVHRDVKPANVLLDEDGEAYLSDFGIAADAAATVSPPHAASSPYLSPEQARGEPATARTDVFSLGAVLREATRGSGVPRSLRDVVARATAEDPAERYPDADALAHALAALSARPRGTRAEPVRNPYKGLRPFSEADAADFFGRESLVERLVERFRRGERFVALVGASGTGKSSAVRAGLFPALRAGDDWLLAEMSPGTRPLEELEEALRRVAVESADEGIVLFVDQLEELFALVDDPEARAAFLGRLAEAASDPEGRVRVVIALRADAYDRPLEHREFAALLRSGVETVLPPAPGELERAITEPASRAGVMCEAGLVGALVADVAGRAGGLPLLQYALTELFERRRDGELTRDAYRELGGLGGAVARRADELYAQAGGHAREAARQLFLRLVALGSGAAAPRSRVPRAELDSLEVEPAALEKLLEAYGRHRLLSFDRDPITRAPTVEVAHEALLEAWGRLRDWLREARQDVELRARLTAAAAEWDEAGRDESFLLGGARLELFDAWAGVTSIALARTEREYLGAARERRDAHLAEEAARRAREARLERRSRRRLRALVVVLAIAAATAGGLSLYAFEQRRDAEEQARIATARELAAAARATVEDDPELALLLGLEAVRTTRGRGTALREAEEALRTAVHASRVVRSVPGGSAVALAPDGSSLATVRRDGAVIVRETTTGAEQVVLPAPQGSVEELGFGPDGSRIFTVSAGGVRVWDVETGEETRVIAAGHSAAVSQEARVLAVKSGERTAVRSLETDRVLATLTVPGELLAVSDDGGLLAFADEGVRVVSVPGANEVLRAGGAFGDAAFSPDGSLVAVAGTDVELWRLRPRERLLVVDEGHPLTTNVAFSPDGGRFATAGHDGAVRVWDAETGEELLTLAGRGAEIDALSFSADGRLLAAAGKSGRATVWDLTPEGRRELLTIPATSTEPVFFSPAFSADGRRIAGATEAATARVWDAASGRPLATLRGHGAPITDAAFTRDGKRLATTSFDGTAKLWELSAKTEIRSFAGHSAPVWGLALNPDGSRLATVSEDRTARIWDLESGATRLVLWHGDQVYDVDYSPDGSLLATSGLDGGWIWDAATGAQLARLDGHDGNVVQIAFAPDGERVATAGFDGTARLWDAGSGKSQGVLSGHTGIVIDVDVSPDGRWAATASFDGTTRVWDVQTRTELLALREEPAPGRLTFSPDGSRLAVAGGNGTVRVYALRIDDLVQLAGQRLTRDFTDAECRQFLHRDRCATPG